MTPTMTLAGTWRCALATALTTLCAAAPAAAAQLETIVQDDALFLHGTPAQIRAGLDRARSHGMTRVRLTAGWSVIAPDATSPVRPAFAAEDPAAYPPGHWDNLDRAIRMTHEAGLRPMIDIAFWAPRWATQDPRTDRPSLEIDPAEFARFARAVATRYTGGWRPAQPQEPQEEPDALADLLGRRASAQGTPTLPQPLPAVDLYTIWNEPNHPGFLRPQWVKGPDGDWSVRSAQIYREMVRLAHPAIKAAAPEARVLVGGTAPMGSSVPGRSGVPPLRFLRELACVNERLEPVTAGGCAAFTPVPGDGWAHHPYSLRTTPDVDTSDRDKAPVAATPRLVALLRELVSRGRLAPGLADLWLTEYGYETNAPDPLARFDLDEQARLLAWAERIGTSEPAVRSWPQFQLYDRPSAPPRPGAREFGDWHTGLYFNDGTPKPAAAQYATPVHVECRGRRASIWGRLRTGDATGVRVESRVAGGSWRATGAPLEAAVRHRRGTAYRLVWTTRAGDRVSAAAGCATRSARRGRGRPRGSSAAR